MDTASITRFIRRSIKGLYALLALAVIGTAVLAGYALGDTDARQELLPVITALRAQVGDETQDAFATAFVEKLEIACPGMEAEIKDGVVTGVVPSEEN